MTGIELYQKVVIDQDKRFLDREFTNDKGIIIVTKNMHFPFSIKQLRHFMISDWEEIPQEITWQEASRLWAEGKDIYCEFGDKTYEFRGYSDYLLSCCWTRSKAFGVSKDMILHGKWYEGKPESEGK